MSKIKTDKVKRKRTKKGKKLKSTDSFSNENPKNVKRKRFDINKIQKDIPKVIRDPKLKGRAVIPDEILEKYDHGDGVDLKGVKTNFYKKKLEKKEDRVKFATEQAARAEILLTEDPGYLEADDGETTTQFTQKQIAASVDITAATKHFNLNLDFGPYRCKYTRNGRHLLIGGKKGHVAAFDWLTKKLHCELNVMESVHDVCWLHIETMFAVAQKNWVYIYDNQGIELHCVKRLNKISRMEFLPYHFLLSCCSDEGFLGWLDVSMGQMVNQFNTKMGRLSVMTQNPWNAVLCVGHSQGTVSMWSPNSRDHLAKMLCHKAPILGLHVDPRGQYMATAASDNEVKIWDVRALNGPIQHYRMYSSAQNLAFSPTGMLAVGMDNIVEIYRNCTSSLTRKPYLRNRFNNNIANFTFCPFEDVLGVGTGKGFTSMLVPGAGQANYDALELNPFETKKQRREVEVKSLLEKVQPELITLDPTKINQVNLPSLKEKLEAKEKLLFVKPPKIDFEPKNKMGRGSSAAAAKNKKIVKELAKREFIKENAEQKPKPNKVNKNISGDILDRFLPVKR